MTSRRSAGSALILTVVLTSVLAIVGVLFLMLSRMAKISASASSQARQLDLAVDAVIAAVDDQLMRDTPGVIEDKEGQPAGEYEDCPNANDLWLASLEPDPNAGGTPFWPQISVLEGTAPISRVRVQIIPERGAIDPNEKGLDLADADGDGIADACWFRLKDVATGRAQPVYAAVRIIDHGGMLNVNTATLLDPTQGASNQDGSNQMQIDLTGLAARKIADSNAAVLGLELNAARAGGDTSAYLSGVVWNYGDAPAPFRPFEISDELELRNRFLLNNRDGFQGEEVVVARIERLWRISPANAGSPSWVYCPFNGKDVPYEASADIPIWAGKVSWIEPGGDYDYRHLSTVVNMDRIIDPAGRRMVDVNRIVDANGVAALVQALVKGGLAEPEAAQVAVNVRNFADSDVAPTSFTPPGSSVTYYGMEPQPFIRQIGFKISATDPVTPINNEFMVELYNPYDVDIDLKSFVLSLLDAAGKPGGQVDFRSGERIKARQSLVLVNKAAASLGQGLGDRRNYDSLVLALFVQPDKQASSFVLSQRRDLLLVRTDGTNLNLDRQKTSNAWFDWNKIKDAPEYYARANGKWNILYPRMPLVAGAPFLSPKYNLPQPQALPLSGKGFVTVGDIGRILRVGPSTDPNSETSLIRVTDQTPQPSDDQVCLNVADPCVAGVFRYVTVLSPETFGHPATETRVKGRVNINAAPAFVLDRLPWLQWAADTKLKSAQAKRIGQAIVDDRAAHGPFRSIGDLMRVPEMTCLVDSVNDQSPSGPDLTPDSEPNDLEERDLLFDRISNLVTVRSDVFSAYIVVRIGIDGPQRRVLAILDRSGVTPAGGKVQCITLHTVPDPR